MTYHPTRYEITARHPDGREYLVCYWQGSKSGRSLWDIIDKRHDAIWQRLGTFR